MLLFVINDSSWSHLRMDYNKKNAGSRGCLIKKFPNVLLNNAKVVNPTVKPQAKGQNYFSIALKWGIVHLCILNILRGTMKFRKISVF